MKESLKNRLHLRKGVADGLKFDYTFRRAASSCSFSGRVDLGRGGPLLQQRLAFITTTAKGALRMHHRMHLQCAHACQATCSFIIVCWEHQKEPQGAPKRTTQITEVLC